jgi:NADH-quinone oxidoreductase subunit J
MIELFWWIFASLAVGGALLAVTRKNPVASLLCLLLTFFCLAAIFVLLGAHFIAAIQVIVGAGAMLVLFLFVLMLLNLGHDYRADLRGAGWILGGFAAVGAVGSMVWRAVGGDARSLALEADAMAMKATPTANAIAAIGEPLYRDFMVEIQLTAVLLLVAVVGAVLLAKRTV